MVEKVIIDLLENDEALTALIDKRVFAIKIPQNEPYPAISFERVTTDYLPVKGFEKLGDEIAIQINIFSEGYLNALEIAEAVKTIFDYKNTFENSGVAVCSIEPAGEMDGVYDEELKLYHRILKYDFSIS